MLVFFLGLQQPPLNPKIVNNLAHVCSGQVMSYLLAGMELNRGIKIFLDNAGSPLKIGQQFPWYQEEDYWYGWAEILFDLSGRKFPTEDLLGQWLRSHLSCMEHNLWELGLDADYRQYLNTALNRAYSSSHVLTYLYLNKPPTHTPATNQHDQQTKKANYWINNQCSDQCCLRQIIYAFQRVPVDSQWRTIVYIQLPNVSAGSFR